MTQEGNGFNATMLLSPYGGNIGGYGGYPMVPMTPYMNNGGGLFGGGDSWLGILFLIALCNGGFGFGGGFGGGFGNMMLGYDFPWLLNGQQGINNNVSSGFRDAQITDGITSVRDSISALATQLCQCCGDMQLNVSNGFNSVNQNLNTGFAGVNQNVASGFAGVNQNLCNGFAGVNASINGAQNAIAQQMYANQIADLERSYNAQTATTQGFTNVQTGIADLKYTEATEACATRTASAQNTRDITDAIRNGNQAILDKLCALELDGVKGQLAQAQRENVSLQNAVNMATLRESQANQTAIFQQGLNNEVDALYNRLKNCPVNTVPVYGNQPIFTCPVNNNNSGCGCGSF